MNFALEEKHEQYRESIVKFARKELSNGLSENEREGRFPIEEWRKCAEIGLLSLLTPKEYDGLGEDLLSALLYPFRP